MASGTVLASSLSLDEIIFFFMQIDHSVVVIYVNPEERLHNFPHQKYQPAVRLLLYATQRILLMSLLPKDWPEFYHW